MIEPRTSLLRTITYPLWLARSLSDERSALADVASRTTKEVTTSADADPSTHPDIQAEPTVEAESVADPDVEESRSETDTVGGSRETLDGEGLGGLEEHSLSGNDGGRDRTTGILESERSLAVTVVGVGAADEGERQGEEQETGKDTHRELSFSWET